MLVCLISLMLPASAALMSPRSGNLCFHFGKHHVQHIRFQTSIITLSFQRHLETFRICCFFVIRSALSSILGVKLENNQAVLLLFQSLLSSRRDTLQVYVSDRRRKPQAIRYLNEISHINRTAFPSFFDISFIFIDACEDGEVQERKK
jgi:hypothetical protein